jgi:two-component system, cell cycle response regulator
MDKSFNISTVGLVEQERTLLGFTLGLSQRRQTRYALTSAIDSADILFFDSAALTAEHNSYVAHVSKGRLVFIVGGQSMHVAGVRIERPIRWMQLLALLDEAAAKLPTARVQTHAQAPATARSPSPQANTVSKPAAAALRDNVLVVDDSPAVRQFMRNRLAAFNVDVDFAETGEQAVAQASAKKYAAVFLDVVLPGADGYHVCRMIRSAKTAFQPVVIMLTSRDSAFDKIRGKMVGCTAYLTKPVDDELLFATFRKFLSTPEHATPVQRTELVSV